jgi:hypothetical protein
MNEKDYVDIMSDPGITCLTFDSFVEHAPSLLIQNILKAPLTVTNVSSSQKNTHHNEFETWKPFFSGYPKSTIFIDTDYMSERWSKTNEADFYQVMHLMSDLNETCYLVQLSYLTRRVHRYNRRSDNSNSTNKTSASFKHLNASSKDEIMDLHNSLIEWYHSIPRDLRLWESLDVLLAVEPNPRLSFHAVVGGRLSSTCILINLLFFYSLTFLHQVYYRTNNQKSVLGAQNILPEQYLISKSGMPISSLGVIIMAYKAQTKLLMKLYGGGIGHVVTGFPPSELVGSPLIPILLIASPIALLFHPQYSQLMLDNMNNFAFPSLEQSILPILDNINQVLIYSFTLGLADSR